MLVKKSRIRHVEHQKCILKHMNFDDAADEWWSGSGTGGVRGEGD